MEITRGRKLCNRKYEKKEIYRTEKIEYVVYCRKSTDESSGKQVQSITDQIRICMEFSERERLTVMKKPINFPFETEEEKRKEEEESDGYSKDIYKRYENYFIIKEQKTSKIAGVRSKRQQLIKMVKLGEIKGIISYLPDRQARNMLEAGELIDLLDKGMVDLKYPNFNFTNNASGKMMLGIHFAISKEYSDNISEGVRRGGKSKILRGKTMGTRKYGYFRNKEDFYEPHEKYFPLLQEGLKMKLEYKSDRYITDRLNNNGFTRVLKTGEERGINIKSLAKTRTDPFYYGILVHGDNESDQRELNPYYKPLMTEEQYQIILDRHYEMNGTKSIYTSKQENEEIYPFEYGTVITEDGYVMTPNIPNKRRFENKVLLEREKGNNCELYDVVKPINIKYTCQNKNSMYYRLEVSYETIKKSILKSLKERLLSREQYQEYSSKGEKYIIRKMNNIKEEKKKLELHKYNLNKMRNDFIKSELGKKRDCDEERIYQNEKWRLQEKVDNITKEIDKMEDNLVEVIEIYKKLLKMIERLYWYYDNSNHVRRKKLGKIFCSNIKIRSQTSVETLYNSRFSMIILPHSSNGADNETRTRSIFLGKEVH